jgi:hypothetical protein
MSPFTFLNTLLRDYPLLILIGLIIYISFKLYKEFIKYTTKSDFDKIFDTKDQINWEDGYKKVVFSVFFVFIIHIISWSFTDSYKENPSFIWHSVLPWIFLCSVFLFIVSLGLLFIHLLLIKVITPIIKKLLGLVPAEGISDNKKRYYKLLIYSHFISAYILSYACSAMNVRFLLSETPDWISFGLGFGALILLTIGYYHLFRFFMVDIFEIEKPIQYIYQMTIPNNVMIRNKPLYVLYSLDKDHIVLGDCESESQSNALYVYDRDKDKYMMFTRRKKER